MRANLKSSVCAAAVATAALCLSSATDFDPFHTDLLSAHAGGAPAFGGKGKDGRDVADDAKDKGTGKGKDKGEDKDEDAEVAKGDDDDVRGNDNGGNDAIGASDDVAVTIADDRDDSAELGAVQDGEQWNLIRRRQTPTQTDGDI